MIGLKILLLKKEDDQAQSHIVAGNNAQSPPPVELTHRGPSILKEQSPGIGHKEQEAGEHKKERHARSTKGRNSARERIGLYIPELIMDHPIDMKSDYRNGCNSPHPIQRRNDSLAIRSFSNIVHTNPCFIEYYSYHSTFIIANRVQ